MTAPKAQRRAVTGWPEATWRFFERRAAAGVLLVTFALVAGVLAVQCTNQPAIPTAARPAAQLCLSGPIQASKQFALVQGYITYTYGSKIWAVDPNQPANRISLGPSNGMTPITWSRDGSRLLLMELRNAGTAQQEKDLCVLNGDGSQTRLTSDGRSREASFSPDGTEVVFSRLADHGLYLVDANGGVPRMIAKSSGYVGSPTWLPDGSRIAYTVYREFGPNGSTFEIWTLNPDGTDPRQLVDLGQCGGGGCSGGLAWSPDGSTLVFHSFATPVGAAELNQIYIVRADGSRLHRVNDDGFQPSWSPDGSRIAFLRFYGFAELSLYTMARDGSDVRQVEGVFIQPSSLAWNPVG